MTAMGMKNLEERRIDNMPAAYGRPPGDGPFPGVVVLHEAYGLNDDIARITQRFVQEGYAAVAPDLLAPGFKPLCIARAMFDMVRGGGGSVDRVERARSWLAEQPAVDPERIGVIGFCMGGAFALAAAVRFDFRSASVNYGRVPAKRSDLEGVCPVVASYGQRDRMLLSHAERLERLLSELGVPHDVKIYPEAGHSFMNQATPSWMNRLMYARYDEESAEDAWARILAFFQEHLAPKDAHVPS